MHLNRVIITGEILFICNYTIRNANSNLGGFMNNNRLGLLQKIMNCVVYFFQLTRCYNYLTFVFFITAFAFHLNGGSWNSGIIISYFSNLLAVVSGYIFNDTEDAVEDSIDPFKQITQRNRIASGKLSKLQGYILSIFAAVSSLVLAFFLGNKTLLCILLSLLLLFLYSWRVIRFKSRPVIDVVVHGGMAGLLFIASYLSNFEGRVEAPILNQLLAFFVLSFIWALSLLQHQLSDFEHDSKMSLKTTAIFLGRKKTKFLIFTMIFFILFLTSSLIMLGSLLILPIIISFSISGSILGVLFWITKKQRTRFKSEWFQRIAYNLGGIVGIAIWISL